MSLNRSNISAQIANKLTEEIICGRLSPREPIREKDWAQQLDVGRSSVREALLILERRHLVDLRPGKGARVADLGGRWLTEVFEHWYLLFESAVIKAASSPITDDFEEFHQEHRSLQLLAQRDSRQHFFDQAIGLVVLVAERADNQLLSKQIHDLLPAARRVYRWILWQDEAEISRSLKLAERLMSALIRRDSTAASQAVSDYARLQRLALDRSLAAAFPA